MACASVEAVTYFICFTIVLFPDSPAPEKEEQCLKKHPQKTPPHNISQLQSTFYTSNLFCFNKTSHNVIYTYSIYTVYVSKHPYDLLMLDMRQPYRHEIPGCATILP